MVAPPPTTVPPLGPASANPIPSGNSAVVASMRLRKKRVMSAILVPRGRDEEHARVVAHAFDCFGNVEIHIELIGPAEADAGADRAPLQRPRRAEHRIEIGEAPVDGEDVELSEREKAGR